MEKKKTKSILIAVDWEIGENFRKITHMKNLSMNSLLAKMIDKYVKENLELVDLYNKVIKEEN